MGADFTRLTVMSVGAVPELIVIWLLGLPKESALPPETKPVRLTLPTTSNVSVELPVAGCVSMFVAVVMSLPVSASTPLTVTFWLSVRPALLLLLRLLKVVALVPPIDCVDEPLKLTVPELALNVLPLFVQLPERLSVPLKPVTPAPLLKVRLL